MTSKVVLVCSGLMLTCLVAYSHMAFGAAENRIAQAQSDSGYRVGDTLAAAKPGAASGDYDDILWETLLGEGWSPEQQMESLNLNELADNDPKARAILQKIREMWDTAPVNPKLDIGESGSQASPCRWMARRTRRASFCWCPISVRAFTHPPPANQVIHVVVDKSVKTVKLSPALWISGTMRTVRSDTRMGASGYEMTVDKVEPYKLEYSPF